TGVQTCALPISYGAAVARLGAVFAAARREGIAPGDSRESRLRSRGAVRAAGRAFERDAVLRPDDADPADRRSRRPFGPDRSTAHALLRRSEEHTSELQSREILV